MPKHNRGNFLLLGIIIFLAVGVAGTTVYFLTKKTPPVSETPRQEVSKQPVSQKPEESTSTQPEESTSTEEIDTSDWKTYRNEEYGFEIKYPKEGVLLKSESDWMYSGCEDLCLGDEKTTAIKFPFPKGTKLIGKCVLICVKKVSPGKCKNLISTYVVDSRLVNINGIEFLRVEGTDCGMGKCYLSRSYTVGKEDKCITIVEVLKVFMHIPRDTKLLEYDYEKEMSVIDKIMSTFKFINYDMSHR